MEKSAGDGTWGNSDAYEEPVKKCEMNPNVEADCDNCHNMGCLVHLGYHNEPKQPGDEEKE